MTYVCHGLRPRDRARLQYLEALYRQGYRSEVIDRSLDKIIALERAAARRELADPQERLQSFETRYQRISVGNNRVRLISCNKYKLYTSTGKMVR